MESTDGNGTLSVEEVDHLECNNKKIKSNDGSSSSNQKQEARSFKNTLLWGRKDEAGMEMMGNIDKVAFDMDEERCIDSEGEDEVEDVTVPRVKFSKDLCQSMQRPWLSSLIVKLLGKTISFTAFEARVMKLRALTGEVDFIDLGLGYYVVKFECKEDVLKVLTRGP